MASEPSRPGTVHPEHGHENASFAGPAPAAASSTVNLHVSGPSLQGPLVFTALSTATTIWQLKELIRQNLAAQPAPDKQRLISRGRPLMRDGDTLLDIFGAETVQSTDKQTIHLVIREHVDPRPGSTVQQPSSQSSVPPPPAIAAGNQPFFVQTQTRVQMNPQTRFQPAVQAYPQPQPQPRYDQLRVTPVHQPVNASPQFPPLLPAPIPFQIQAQQIHVLNQQQVLNTQWAQWIQHQRDLQRAIYTPRPGAAEQPAFATALPVAMPLPSGTPLAEAGAGVGLGVGVGAGLEAGVGLQPGIHTTIMRETVGPTGQQFQVTVNETVIRSRTSTPIQQPITYGPLSMRDVQQVMNQAEAAAGSPFVANADPRNSPGSLGRTFTAAGPVTPAGQSAVPTGHPAVQISHTFIGQTPDIGRRVFDTSLHPAPATPARPSTTVCPEVYILQSPHGPRALLIHGGTDMYISPTFGNARVPTSTLSNSMSPLLRATIQTGIAERERMGRVEPPASSLLYQHQHQQHLQRRAHRHQQPPPAAAGVDGRARAPDAAALRQDLLAAVDGPNNNAGLGLLVAQLWPHFWLLLRLAAFVWWFTSPSSTWTRWSAVVGIAFIIFMFNLGILNGFVDQAWGPLRRHLENLIPLANPAANPAAHPRPPQVAVMVPVDRNPHNPPNWLMSAALRVERASLLFLASIAPGVAERHIAHMVQAEARAAAASAQAAAQAAAVEQAQTPTAPGVPAGEAEANDEAAEEARLLGPRAMAAT